MYDDVRLDTKLSDLSRELNTRQLGAGFTIVEAFTMKGFDEVGKPGLFALVLLGNNPPPSLDTLTIVRSLLTARLKQIDTSMPQWPIVVHAVEGSLSDRQLDDYLREATALMQHEGTYVAVMDASRICSPEKQAAQRPVVRRSLRCEGDRTSETRRTVVRFEEWCSVVRAGAARRPDPLTREPMRCDLLLTPVSGPSCANDCQ